MIVRILGEGQYDVSDVEQDALQSFDQQVETAVDSGDEAAVHEALVKLREFILSHGSPVADDYLGQSDAVVPNPDAGIAEISELLNGDGLVPGV